MAISKRGLVGDALGELGLASYVFDITPEEMTAAVRRLDQMMAAWNKRGIRIAYSLSVGDGGEVPDSDSGIPDTAQLAVTTNLALLLAPGYGKTPSPDTRTVAKAEYAFLCGSIDAPGPMARGPGLPMGAGNRCIGRDYFCPDPDPLTAGNDSELEF